MCCLGRHPPCVSPYLFSSQKAGDAGHLGNPAIPRVFIPRFDEAILDVHAAEAPKTNPYALAVHIRHPPPGIMPNVMRLQARRGARGASCMG